MPHTSGTWRTEAVSDAVRVVVGEGWKKIILARLNPPQLPENETHTNGRLMAAAPDHAMVARILTSGLVRWEPLHDVLRAAISKMEGK